MEKCQFFLKREVWPDIIISFESWYYQIANLK